MTWLSFALGFALGQATVIFALFVLAAIAEPD